MWSQLRVWKKRQMLVVGGASICGAAVAAAAGDYTMLALFLWLPVLDVVETWGELDRTRRTWRYWMVMGTLLLAWALLLGSRVIRAI